LKKRLIIWEFITQRDAITEEWLEAHCDKETADNVKQLLDAKRAEKKQ